MKKLKPVGSDINAYTFSFDDEMLDEIRLSYRMHIEKLFQEQQYKAALDGGRIYGQPFGDGEPEYYLVSYNQAPLLWLSSNTDSTYQIYKRFFDKIGIGEDLKNLIDCEKDIVVYCGFLVISNKAPAPLWHVDYDPGANAYTLLTPLFELEKEHGNLLYFNAAQQLEKYSYKNNEAIIFGDRFRHTTEPYPESDKLRVLACLQFGSDKIAYWPILSQTIATQSSYLILPCGHRSGTCECTKRDAPLNRNDPCPCGSGLRYKHCHGKLT